MRTESSPLVEFVCFASIARKSGNESLGRMLVNLSVAVSGVSEQRLDHTTGVRYQSFQEK